MYKIVLGVYINTQCKLTFLSTALFTQIKISVKPGNLEK